jgi:hypothetical protein
MDAATRDFVRRRADNRCEYCLLRQKHSDLTHHIEHFVQNSMGMLLAHGDLTCEAGAVTRSSASTLTARSTSRNPMKRLAPPAGCSFCYRVSWQ